MPYRKQAICLIAFHMFDSGRFVASGHASDNTSSAGTLFNPNSLIGLRTHPSYRSHDGCSGRHRSKNINHQFLFRKNAIAAVCSYVYPCDCESKKRLRWGSSSSTASSSIAFVSRTNLDTVELNPPKNPTQISHPALIIPPPLISYSLPPFLSSLNPPNSHPRSKLHPTPSD